MKLTLSRSAPFLIVFSSLAVNALPGGQQRRGNPVSTLAPFQTAMGSSTSAMTVQSYSSGDVSSVGPTVTATTTSTTLEPPSSQISPTMSMTARREGDSLDQDGRLLDTLLDPLSVALGGDQFDGDNDDYDDDDESCDEYDDMEDSEYGSPWRPRQEDESDTCWSAIGEVLSQLDEIKAMIKASALAPIIIKREIGEVTYGKHEAQNGSLTSETHDGSSTLSSGNVDEHLGSEEQTTHMIETGQDTLEQAVPTTTSSAAVSSMSPWSSTQMNSLLALLDTFIISSQEKEPSTSKSQNIHKLSREGFTALSESSGSLRDSRVESTAPSPTPDTDSIITQLQRLRNEKQDPMAQSNSGSSPMYLGSTP